MEIKDYKTYCAESMKYDMNIHYSDIFESMNIFQDALLSSIDAEYIDFKTLFGYSIDSKMDLDVLVSDGKFIGKLKELGFIISNVESTKDYQTFAGRDLKFATVRREGQIELTNPLYILIQNFSDTENAWAEFKVYEVKDNINKFYDMLSSKTIEIEDKNGDSYIYKTTNSGNEWELMNPTNKDNNIFKDYLRRDDLKSLIKNTKDIKISII